MLKYDIHRAFFPLPILLTEGPLKLFCTFMFKVLHIFLLHPTSSLSSSSYSGTATL